MYLDIIKAIKIIKNEKKCVERADACDRDCAKCDLVMSTKDILEAYDLAIDTLWERLKKR